MPSVSDRKVLSCRDLPDKILGEQAHEAAAVKGTRVSTRCHAGDVESGVPFHDAGDIEWRRLHREILPR